MGKYKSNSKSISWDIFIIAFLILALIFVDQISDEKIKMNSIIILLSIIFAGLIYQSYKDFKDKSYSTNVFITITNIAIIILDISYVFMLFNYKVTNIDDLVKRGEAELIITFLLFILTSLKLFLRSERFLKEDS